MCRDHSKQYKITTRWEGIRAQDVWDSLTKYSFPIIQINVSQYKAYRYAYSLSKSSLLVEWFYSEIQHFKLKLLLFFYFLTSLTFILIKYAHVLLCLGRFGIQWMIFFVYFKSKMCIFLAYFIFEKYEYYT